MREHKDKEYPHSRVIRRITERDQILDLFDVQPEPITSGRYKKYTGTIRGVDARLSIRENNRCYVFAKTAEELDVVYNTLIDMLLGTAPKYKGSRSPLDDL